MAAFLVLLCASAWVAVNEDQYAERYAAPGPAFRACDDLHARSLAIEIRPGEAYDTELDRFSALTNDLAAARGKCLAEERFSFQLLNLYTRVGRYAEARALIIEEGRRKILTDDIVRVLLMKVDLGEINGLPVDDPRSKDIGNRVENTATDLLQRWPEWSTAADGLWNAYPREGHSEAALPSAPTFREERRRFFRDPRNDAGTLMLVLLLPAGLLLCVSVLLLSRAHLYGRPSVKIFEAKPGQIVTLEGHLSRSEQLTHPREGVQCIWYDRVTEGIGTMETTVVPRPRGHLVLSDGTGKAWLYLDTAGVSLPPGRTWLINADKVHVTGEVEEPADGAERKCLGLTAPLSITSSVRAFGSDLRPLIAAICLSIVTVIFVFDVLTIFERLQPANSTPWDVQAKAIDPGAVSNRRHPALGSGGV